MKQPWEWDEDDLQSLIDTPVQESISLDYKQCDALAKTDKKKNEVSKDVLGVRQLSRRDDCLRHHRKGAPAGAY